VLSEKPNKTLVVYTGLRHYNVLIWSCRVQMILIHILIRYKLLIHILIRYKLLIMCKKTEADIFWSIFNGVRILKLCKHEAKVWLFFHRCLLVSAFITLIRDDLRWNLVLQIRLLCAGIL